MSRWRRILIGFGITVIVCCTYAWFFGFQTMTMVQTRRMGRKAPVVWLTPQSLPDNSITATPGTTLSYFGYDFEVPWDDVDESKTKILGTRVVVAFRSGRAMLFMKSPPRAFVNAILEQPNGKAFQQVYGDQPLQTDYAMWSMIANATPGKITLLTPDKEDIGLSILLVLKAIAAPEESGLYSIQSKEFKGFQWGEPQRQPRTVVADFFADDAGLEFVFVGPGRGKPLGFSQADINRVLQTVHKNLSQEHAAELPSQISAMAK